MSKSRPTHAPSKPRAAAHRETSRGDASRRERWSISWPAIGRGAALVALVLVVYVPVWNNGFIWDDEHYIVDNLTLRSPEGLRRIWFEPRSIPQYYPLVHTTFWVEYQLWQDKPTGYHVVNMLLHAAACVLFWRVLVRLGLPGAWLAAAIYAVHPVCVESVAWATERKNVLAGALALGSLLAYLRFSPLDKDRNAESAASQNWNWYALSLGLFVLALLSKTVVAMLAPAVLVLIWWKRGRITLADVGLLAPYFAMGACLGLVTAWLEVHHVGAKDLDFGFSPIDRVLIAGRALWFYAGKLVWPWPLAFFYERWDIDPRAWWQYVYPAAALAVMVALWAARRRIGRGPLAAVLIFAGVLFPALGFLDVYPFRFSFVADHFQYHASMALIALGASGVTVAIERLPRPRRPIGWSAVAAYLVTLAILTIRQIPIYENLETLYRDTIAKSPQELGRVLNLSYHLYEEGRRPEAMELAEQALELHPNAPNVHLNMGLLLARPDDGQTVPPKRLEEGIRHIRKALELDEEYTEAHDGLADALILAGDIAGAEHHLRRSIALRPGGVYAPFRLGALMAEQGKWQEGEQFLRMALANNPDYPEGRHALGLILSRQGRFDEARAELQTAVALNPKEPAFHRELALGYPQQQQWRAAAQHLRVALELEPQNTETMYNLAAALINMGDVDRAIGLSTEILRIQPDHPAAAATLQRAHEIKARQSGGR